MASRFWAGSSESESESESGSDEFVETTQVKEGRKWEIESESSSEDERRVVRSAKERAFEGVQKSIAKIRNSMKINDWSSILTEFDDLTKQLEKAKAVIENHGLPKTYIQLLAKLEDLVNGTLKDKETQKKMNKENMRSFNRMKVKLKKHNASYEKQISEYRKNPDAYASDEESEDSSESDESDSDESSSSSSSSDEASSEEESEDEGKPSRKKSVESDDSDFFGGESSSSSESEDEDYESMPKGRARWLKSTTVEAETKAEKKKPKEKGPSEKKVRKLSYESRMKQEEQQQESLTPEAFDRKLKETVAQRGKRGTDINEHLKLLRKLATLSMKFGPLKEIPARMHLVSAQLFDTQSKIDALMTADQWRLAHGDIQRVLTVLEDNPKITLAGLSAEDHAEILRAGRGELKDTPEEETSAPPVGEAEGVIRVAGSVFSFLERLADEYTKSLQQIDPHSSDYVDRLYDEDLLLDLADGAQKYYVRINDKTTAAQVATLRIEYTHYKHDSIARALQKARQFRNQYGRTQDLHPACRGENAKSVKPSERNASVLHPGSWTGSPSVEAELTDTEALMRDLCSFVYKHGDDRAKTRAMLCHIFHHSIHDRFYQARDLLLMSHLQESITYADVPTQILFNRTMAQLGLCAFRSGLIYEAHSCLSELCSGARTKELLAQGMQSARFSDKNPEQEKAEKRRQIPFHMHINLELLECVHLTSAMLLEVPNMAQHPTDYRRRLISKSFRRYLEISDRQVFNGPPENTRDHVVAGAKALAAGNWKRCCELILGLKVWNLIPGEGAVERVKGMLQEKVKIEALRTYLFSFSAYYDSMSLPQLCKMFELPPNKVHSVFSKMMINEEVHAAWDQTTESVVFQRVEPTQLQALALQFAEKASMFVESNERLLDSRSGGYAYKDDWQGGRGERRGWTDRPDRNWGGRDRRDGDRPPRWSNQVRTSGRDGIRLQRGSRLDGGYRGRRDGSRGGYRGGDRRR